MNPTNTSIFDISPLDQLRLVIRSSQRTEDAVDAIAGVAEDAFDAPFGETLNDEVADLRAHRALESSASIRADSQHVTSRHPA